MVGELFASLSAFKTMMDMTKAVHDAHDVATRDRAVIELQKEILTAQAAQATLVQRVSELEKEVARLKAWEGEKERYQLTDVGSGTFAYALKASMCSSEPPHYICANCYQQSKKSILHHMQKGGGGHHVLLCSSCDAKMLIRHGYKPPIFIGATDDSSLTALESCPLCQSGKLVITDSTSDPDLGVFGVQQRTLTCDNPQCKHRETRQYDPDK